MKEGREGTAKRDKIRLIAIEYYDWEIKISSSKLELSERQPGKSLFVKKKKKKKKRGNDCE